MFKKRNTMKYFSGNAFARLPLYKLMAGGMAVALTAGIGLSVMAAGLTEPPPAPEPTPTPLPKNEPVFNEVIYTPEEITPVLELEATVIQQDIGIEVYVVRTETPPVFDDPEDEEAYVPVTSRTPLSGVEAVVMLTDADGTTEEYQLDSETGAALAEDREPGDYLISMLPLEGYEPAAEQAVTVKEKVVYKADVEAVKDKIVQSSQVNESAEDSASNNAGAAPIAEEVTDTVGFSDSSKTETGSGIVYSAQLSASGHLLLTDGTETPYLPVYEPGTKNLIGAVRDSGYQAGVMVTAAAGRNAEVVALAGSTAERIVHRTMSAEEPTEGTTSENTAVSSYNEGEFLVTGEETTAPAEPTAEPPAESVSEPTEQQPEVTEQPTAPSEESSTSGNSEGDVTAGWPDQISAAELAGYDFAVSEGTATQYQYTGWQEIDGATYYYDPETHLPVTGSQVIQGNIYSFGADGALNRTARGVDVSKFQGSIDWNAVKADGITFAIIRCGYRGYGSGALVEDSTYRENINGAIAAGLSVGVYFYSQAINEEEAVEEASMVLSLINGYSLPMGVYYDTEKVDGGAGRADGISAAQRTACAVAFCETISSGGYTPGVYSYASWFYNGMHFANISKYRIWIAQYRDTLDFSYKYNIWQYTGSGSVNGISKKVDINIG